MDTTGIPFEPLAGGQNVHAWAKGVLDGQYPGATGKTDATDAMIQGIQSVGWHEANYGRATKPAAWVGSNNWGAVQCCKAQADGTCPAGSFLATDYDAKSDKKYTICFKSYASPEAGAADLIRHMTKVRPHTWAALRTGDADQIAAAMYAEHYYGGYGATDAIRVKGYSDAIAKAAQAIAAGTGGPLLVTQRGGGGGAIASGGSGGGGLLIVAGGLGLLALTVRGSRAA